MPSQISRHHKKPVLRAFSVYTFHVFFKKSISITPTKRANRSSHHQFACSMVRPFNSFHSLRLLRSSSVHSCVPVAHAPVTATLAWHFVPCSLRLHSFTSSLNSFASLLRSLTHSTHFHVRPLSHASRICQGSLLAISTIRVASRVRDK